MDYKGLINISFTKGDDEMEIYCRKTMANVKMKLMTDSGKFSIALKHILFELCLKYNNGYGTDIKTPEVIKTEEVRDFYNEPDQMERIKSLIEKKSLNIEKQRELRTLAESLNPAFKINSTDDARRAIRIYYLKTEEEPEPTIIIENPMDSMDSNDSYYCNECNRIHYSRGIFYKEHKKFATYDSEIQDTIDEFNEVPEDVPEEDKFTDELTKDDLDRMEKHMDAIDKEPYMCSQCKRVHKKGKIYEDHKHLVEEI